MQKEMSVPNTGGLWHPGGDILRAAYLNALNDRLRAVEGYFIEDRPLFKAGQPVNDGLISIHHRLLRLENADPSEYHKSPFDGSCSTSEHLASLERRIEGHEFLSGKPDLKSMPVEKAIEKGSHIAWQASTAMAEFSAKNGHPPACIVVNPTAAAFLRMTSYHGPNGLFNMVKVVEDAKQAINGMVVTDDPESQE